MQYALVSFQESIFTESESVDNDDGNSTDSDAFHIDLKRDTSPRNSSYSDSEHQISEIQGPISPIDNQSDDSEEMDDETKLLMEKSNNVSIPPMSNLCGDFSVVNSPASSIPSVNSAASNPDFESFQTPSPNKVSRSRENIKVYICVTCIDVQTVSTRPNQLR
jgi:hypothetical protein